MHFLIEKKEDVENSLLNFIPAEINEEWLISVFGKRDYNIELFRSFLDPIWDLLSRGGKRWRPALLHMCYKACGGTKSISEYLPFVEIIHNGTLMVDDVEDNSDKRRGKPCIHKIYGTDVAINTGNLMYFLPFNILKNSSLSQETKLKLYEIVCDEMVLLSVGQGMDIAWHKGITDDIKEEEYLLMCAYKTGTLARMSAKMGAILAKADENIVNALGKFAESIGVAFQIQDDILNISNTDWGKDFGDDISEGKRTLMVIYVLSNGTEKDKKRLLEILNMKTKDQKLIKEAIEIINKYGACEYAFRIAKIKVLNALEDIEELLPETKEKQELRDFAHFVIERKI